MATQIKDNIIMEDEKTKQPESGKQDINAKVGKAKVFLKKGATTAHGVLKTAKSLGVPVPKAAIKISGMVANKVRVYSRTRNHAALGLVHAYMAMNPDATLEDLRCAFPDDLCHDSGVLELFITARQTASCDASQYFAKPEEMLSTDDGQAVAMCQTWSKTSFDRLVSAAANYGIEVAKIDETRAAGEAGFSLKYLNGYVPPVKQKKNRSKWWMYLLVIALIIAAIVIVF